MQPDALYTRVPSAIRSFYRREQRESDAREVERIRKSLEEFERIISSPTSTDEERRLARIEFVGRVFQPNGDEDDNAA